MKQIISIQNLKFSSINRKYIKHKYTGQLILSPEYRQFKDLIILSTRKGYVKPPYKLSIEIETITDIDNSIKVILDGIQAAGVIDDDKHVQELHLYKRQLRRGQAGSLKVYLDTINK